MANELNLKRSLLNIAKINKSLFSSPKLLLIKLIKLLNTLRQDGLKK